MFNVYNCGMFIARHITKQLLALSRQYPVLTLTGPRQSGKTTLVKSEFPKARYISLEAPDQRAFAHEDPRGFLEQFSESVILDEVQRVPDLFSYIQVMVDQSPRPGRFILTGSQNFLLLNNISQTLAGRCAVLHLLPLALTELKNSDALVPESLATVPKKREKADGDLLKTLHAGMYPRVHDQKLDAAVWMANYVQTYIERDVREILNIGDAEAFYRFLRLCAGRAGQLLNLSSLAADCGISHATARRWLSLLEASFIVYLLRPYHRNYNKRLIKSPKLYFTDTGLLCYLLRIRTSDDLASHGSRGAVFETFIISELLKSYFNNAREAHMYFWRDSTGHEVDVMIEGAKGPLPIEIKSAQTVASDFMDSLDYWRKLADASAGPAVLIYGGDESYTRSGIAVHSWRDV
jgi:predicted AAA+ superfamily ATPase